MFHIILFFAVAVMFLISGIAHKAFEAVIFAAIFAVLGVVSVVKYDKKTKTVPIFTSRKFILGVKIFLGASYLVMALVRDEPENFIWSAIWFGSALISIISDLKAAKRAKMQTAAPIQVQAAPMINQNTAVKVLPDAFPDKPQPFGYKSGWLCIKDTTPEQVILLMGLKNSVPANWASGMAQLGDKVFVSPVVRGYVLVIGYDTFQGADAESEINSLAGYAKYFSEMQCFVTERVVDFHCWAKFVYGELTRGYGWLGESGEVYLNRGSITSEEQQLGFDRFIQTDEDDWESVEFPDEESVINIAAAWGVDPMFSDGDYEYGVGYLCDMK